MIAAVGFMSCSKIPNGILPERKMKDVMIDMSLAEGIIGNNYKDFPDSISKAALYQSVFEKHNITQAVYDSSLVWYGKNLNIYMEVIDLATAEINNRIRDLGDVQASAAPTSNRDSVNIWPRRSFLTLEPRALFNGVVFNIQPETNYLSGSAFVLGMKVWGVRDDMRFKPEIRLAIDQGDTSLFVNKAIIRDGYQEVILRGIATKGVRRVYGYIRMDNTDKNYHKVYIDSLNLMRYNYGSPAIALPVDTIRSQTLPADSIN